MKAFALSACLISLHLDALLCGEDYFPHACLDEAFAILIGIPRLDEAFIFYLHDGLSQAYVLYMLISKLVNPFVVVCGNDRPCTVCLSLSRLY